MSSPKLFMLCAILSSLLFSVPTVASASASKSEDVATLSIARAEENVSLAYQAVKDAEGARANISGLLSELNEAGELLAKANMSYRIGDFENATFLADASTEKSDSIKIEAYRIRDLALYQGLVNFQSTIAASILSVAAILFISFTGWHLFKRRYYQRVLKLKPEMRSCES